MNKADLATPDDACKCSTKAWEARHGEQQDLLYSSMQVISLQRYKPAIPDASDYQKHGLSPGVKGLLATLISTSGQLPSALLSGLWPCGAAFSLPSTLELIWYSSRKSKARPCLHVIQLLSKRYQAHDTEAVDSAAD